MNCQLKTFVFTTRFGVPFLLFQMAEKPMLLHVALLSKSKSPELKDRVRNGKSVSKHMVPVLMFLHHHHSNGLSVSIHGAMHNDILTIKNIVHPY